MPISKISAVSTKKTPAKVVAKAKPSPRKSMYTVFMEDLDDNVRLTLVTPSVFDWINSPHPAPRKTGYVEEVPANISKAYAKRNGVTTCDLSMYHCRDDRAARAPGKEFATYSEMKKYIKEHNIKVVDSYHGYMP